MSSLALFFFFFACLLVIEVGDVHFLHAQGKHISSYFPSDRSHTLAMHYCSMVCRGIRNVLLKFNAKLQTNELADRLPLQWIVNKAALCVPIVST